MAKSEMKRCDLSTTTGGSEMDRSIGGGHTLTSGQRLMDRPDNRGTGMASGQGADTTTWGGGHIIIIKLCVLTPEIEVPFLCSKLPF